MSTNIVFEVQDTNQDPDVVEAKRQQMQAKLNARLDARKQQSEASKLAETDSSVIGEKVTQFLRVFDTARSGVDEKLNSWKNIDATDLGKYFDALSISVAEMRESLATASIYLSTFDVQTCQTTIDRLVGSVETTRNEAIPKKKFSFAAAKRKIASNVTPAPADQTPAPILSSLVPKVKEIRNRSNETIKIPLDGESENEANIGDLSIDSLTDCVIYISTVTTAIRINNMTRCKFLIAPTNGSIFIESCKECKFVTASRQNESSSFHFINQICIGNGAKIAANRLLTREFVRPQIRIHETHQTDFYIFTLSRPTIENCSGLRFSPYNLTSSNIDSLLEDCGFKLDQSRWNDVQDFNWLKPDSPNWSTIPASDVEPHQM